MNWSRGPSHRPVITIAVLTMMWFLGSDSGYYRSSEVLDRRPWTRGRARESADSEPQTDGPNPWLRHSCSGTYWQAAIRLSGTAA